MVLLRGTTQPQAHSLLSFLGPGEIDFWCIWRNHPDAGPRSPGAIRRWKIHGRAGLGDVEMEWRFAFWDCAVANRSTEKEMPLPTEQK